MAKRIPHSLISRRNAVKGAALGGSAALVGCGSNDGLGFAREGLSGRPRVAVIGGGAGGIGAAYLLDSVYDVDIFESREKVGGHCDSHVVSYEGHDVTVDLGAQFFHPDTHPLYVTLLEELGLFNPDSPDADETIEAPGSLNMFKVGGSWWPLFSSQYPYLTPFLMVDFLVYTQSARQAILGNMSWETTLEDWVKGLLVSKTFKNTILLPWLSALIGTTLADAKRSSARSILQTFALAFPADIFAMASTYNSKIGLEGNLRRLLEHSPNTAVYVDAPVQSLSFADGAWTLQTALGVQGPYAAVVMNAPPHVSQEMLAGLDWAGDIVDTLGQYEYFPSRLLIHTDAKYVHSDRGLWAVYNGGVDGDKCEGSVWYGGIRGKLSNGKNLDLFKSWASRRRADPSNVLLERTFQHPLITPAAIRAARAIKDFQGLNGLYFSGQFTSGFDLQESALYSAIKVAESLAPESTALASLRTRLEQRGRTGISYDL